MTLDKAIKENKEELKKIITSFEKELNNKDFKTIYHSIFSINLTSAFTALLLKNNINPLEYMNEVPSWFAYELDIKEFEIPTSVTSIENHAFYNCSGLTSVTLPDSVTSIKHYAFCNCIGLTSITIPTSVTSIDYYAFAYCSNITSITIPDSVTDIGESAFACCIGLTSITIPTSVTSIEKYAFQRCNSLRDVYYEGSEEDWENIKIGRSNNILLNANIHYNS